MATRTRVRLNDQQVLQEVGDILTLNGNTAIPSGGLLSLHEHEIDLTQATEGDVLMVEQGRVIARKISGRTNGYDKIYYVSPMGDDETAYPGDYLKTFKTIRAAADAAVEGLELWYDKVMVYVFKGVYQESEICRDAVDMYFDKGSIVYSSEAGKSVLTDLPHPSGVNISIKGKGSFYHQLNGSQGSSDAVNFQYSGSNITLEASVISSIQIGYDYEHPLELKDIKFLAPKFLLNCDVVNIERCTFMEGMVLELENEQHFSIKASNFYLKNNPYNSASVHDIYDEDDNFIFTMAQYPGTTVKNTTNINTTDLLSFNPLEGIACVDLTEAANLVNTSVLIENCTIFLQKEKSVGVNFQATGNNDLHLRIKGVEIIDETVMKETIAVGMGMNSNVTTPAVLGLSGVSHNCKIGKHWAAGQLEIQESIRTLGESTIGTARDGAYGNGKNVVGIYPGMERDEALDRIVGMIDIYAPQSPEPFADKNFILEGFEGIKAGTTTVFEKITYNRAPAISLSGEENNYFLHGDKGVISASVKDGASNIIQSSTKTLTTGDDSGIVGPGNILTLEETLENKIWKVLTAQVKSVSPLSIGDKEHRYQIGYTDGGEKEEFFYVDKENTPIISNETITPDTVTLTNTRKVSGIPVWIEGAKVSFNFIASNVITYFYNKDQVALVESVATETAKTNPDASYALDTPVNVSLTTSVKGEYYNINTPFTLKAFNAGGTKVTSKTVTNFINIDTLSDETKRLSSGSGLYPGNIVTSITSNTDGPGAVFNNNEPLTLNEEMQLSGDYFQYPPAIDYSTYFPVGPDYNTLSGTRWATFNLGSIDNKRKVLFTIEGGEGFVFSQVDGTIKNSGFKMLLFVDGVDGTSGWLDVNSGFYNPAFVPDIDGDPAFDAGNPLNSNGEDIIRVINFGTNGRSGDVYLRIGLTRASAIKFSNISLNTI